MPRRRSSSATVGGLPLGSQARAWAALSQVGSAANRRAAQAAFRRTSAFLNNGSGSGSGGSGGRGH